MYIYICNYSIINTKYSVKYLIYINCCEMYSLFLHHDDYHYDHLHIILYSVIILSGILVIIYKAAYNCMLLNQPKPD